MTQSESSNPKADYGIDAPAVVRNLLLIGSLALLAGTLSLLGLLPSQLTIPVGSVTLVFPLVGLGMGPGVLCTFMGFWMLWDSKVGKVRLREKLLEMIPWNGGEQVLDAGCGLGLMSIGAAKRLTTGKVIGIDIWQTEDLSGNRKEATIENARREGVAEKVAVQTADMRKMPFADATFDVVVSRAAIHNIYDTSGRAQAVNEIARVLKPGGYAIIDDIRHLDQYSEIFTSKGAQVRRVGSMVTTVLLTLATFGSLRPGTLLITKSA